jgi:hypothetical protein
MVSGDSGIVRGFTIDFALIWLRVSVDRGGIHNLRIRAEGRLEAGLAGRAAAADRRRDGR